MEVWEEYRRGLGVASAGVTAVDRSFDIIEPSVPGPRPAAGVGPDGRRRSLQIFAAVVIASVGLDPSLLDFVSVDSFDSFSSVHMFASQAFPLFLRFDLDSYGSLVLKANNV